MFVFFVWIIESLSNKSTENQKESIKAAARLEAKSLIETTHDSFNQYAQNFTQIDVEGSYDECGKGMHGWKRNDKFNEQCEILITHFYEFDGDFSEQIYALANSLKEQNWVANKNNTLEDLIKYYYDAYRDKGTSSDHNYTANNLPEVDRYERDGLTMRFSFADTKDSDIGAFKNQKFSSIQTRAHLSIAEVNKFWHEDLSVPDNSIYNASSGDKQYILSVTIAKKYYED
jgi:hypothetical protein